MLLLFNIASHLEWGCASYMMVDILLVARQPGSSKPSCHAPNPRISCSIFQVIPGLRVPENLAKTERFDRQTLSMTWWVVGCCWGCWHSQDFKHPCASNHGAKRSPIRKWFFIEKIWFDLSLSCLLFRRSNGGQKYDTNTHAHTNIHILYTYTIYICIYILLHIYTYINLGIWYI